MNTSDILNAAADHIQQYGHHKGAGYGGGGPASTAPACTIGAINSAVFLGSNSFKGALSAINALQHHVGEYAVTWNDAPERTAAEVIEALRACAVIEESRNHGLELADLHIAEAKAAVGFGAS